MSYGMEILPVLKHKQRRVKGFGLPMLDTHDRRILENLPWQDILPGQESNQRRDIKPCELSLRVAVLVEAFKNAEKLYHHRRYGYMPSSNCEERRLVYQVIDWIKARDPYLLEPFSLEAVCDALRVSHAPIRAYLWELVKGVRPYRVRGRVKIWHLGTYEYGFWNQEERRYVRRGDRGFTDGAWSRWIKRYKKRKPSVAFKGRK